MEGKKKKIHKGRYARRRRRKRNRRIRVFLAVTVLVITVTVFILYQFGFFFYNKFEIRRTYNEIILRSQKDPGTMTEGYPEFLRVDIETLLESEDKQMIRYHNIEFNSYLLIQENDNNGYEVKLTGLRQNGYGSQPILLQPDFQIYHSGRDIVIYGKEIGSNSVVRYTISGRNSIYEENISYWKAI